MSNRRNDDRRHEFKFQGLTSDELRRRREETTIELRKNKREDSLNKRRNIVDNLPSAIDNYGSDLEQPSAPAFESSSPSEYNRLLHMLYSSEHNSIYDACHAFRKILSKEKNPPIQDIIDLNAVPRFVELLNSSGLPSDIPQNIAEKIVFESAWILTNIASGASVQTMVVVNAGAVPIFVNLLASPNKDIKEQSVWALGNIAGDSSQLRDYILESNVMMNLLQIIFEEMSAPSPYLALVRNAVWALSNLCRGKPSPSWSQIAVALPLITQILSSSDDETLVDACWAMSYITDGPSANLNEVISSGAVAKLTPALRAVGNVVTGDDAQTQYVLDLNVLTALKSLLSSQRPVIQKEACWAISNITAGTVSQIRAVMDANIFPKLIQLLETAEYKTKREACWAVCNATSCFESAPDIIRNLVNQQCLKPLIEMLKSKEPKIIQVVLDGIENILNVGENDAPQNEDCINMYALFLEDYDALDIIYNLQHHEDIHVYNKAKNIIDKFFSSETQNFSVELNEAEHQQFSF